MNKLTARTAAASGLLAVTLCSAAALAAPTTPFTTKLAGVPAVAKHGASFTLKLTVTETATVPSGVVAVGLFDTANKQIEQKFTQNETVAKGKPQTYTYAFTAPGKPGTYKIKVGVFSSQWKTLVSWNDTAGSLKVS